MRNDFPAQRENVRWLKPKEIVSKRHSVDVLLSHGKSAGEAVRSADSLPGMAEAKVIIWPVTPYGPASPPAQAMAEKPSCSKIETRPPYGAGHCGKQRRLPTEIKGTSYSP
ncbi:MAG: hypothetical protein J0I98_03615 [Mesorhizobium sp.]|nr:hypothetical protein [Mesorhizobium sp.]MBN9241860.1 hypothetical protein [Mesorhizobium sp.]